MKTQWWLVPRLVERNRGVFVRLALGLTLVMAMVGGISAVQGTSRAASTWGTTEALGGKLWELTVLIDDPELQAMVAAEPSVVSVWTGQGTFWFDERLAGAAVLGVVSDDAEFGTLVAGRRAETPGEATLSVSVAQSLGAGLGDSISMGIDWSTVDTGLVGDDQEVTVVGWHAYSDRPSEADAVVFLPKVPQVAPDRFLSDTQFAAGSPTDVAHAAGKIRFRSADSLSEQAIDEFTNRSGYGLDVASGAVVLVAVALTATIMLGLLRRLSPARHALKNLMVSPSQVAMIVGAAVGGSAVVGIVVGLVIVRVWGRTATRPIATAIDQRWDRLTFDAAWLVGPTVAIMLVFAIGLGLWAADWRRRGVPLGRPGWFVPTLGSAVVAAACFSVLLRPMFPDMAFSVARAPAALALALSIVVLATACTRIARRRTLGLVRHAWSRRWLSSALVVCAVAFVGSFGGAAILSRVAFEEMTFAGFLADLPAGSLQIESLPLRDAQHLADRYEQLGGESTVVPLVSDSTVLLRATPAEAWACVESGGEWTVEALDRCPNIDYTRVGVEEHGDRVADVTPGAVDAYVTSGLLPQGGDSGTIVLIDYDIEAGVISNPRRLTAVLAPDRSPRVLAGATVTQAAAAELGLDAPVKAALSLNALSYHSPETQAEMRGLIRQVGGQALVINDDPGYQDRGQVALARLLPVVAALVISAQLGVSLLGTSMGDDSLFVRIPQLGVTRSAMRRLTVVSFSPLLLAGVVGCAAGYWLGIRTSPAPPSAVDLASVFLPAVAAVAMIGFYLAREDLRLARWAPARGAA